MVYDEVGNPGYISSNTPVIVLSEPQPEEPTEFGAKVLAGGATALRTQDGTDEVDPDEGPWRVRSGCNTWDDMTWAEVCALGPVQVVPGQGWTVPTDTPEVPERIEEWPEDDVALRAHRWKDRYKNVLDWNKTQWRKTTPSGYAFPADDSAKFDGPWTRVKDA